MNMKKILILFLVIILLGLMGCEDKNMYKYEFDDIKKMEKPDIEPEHLSDLLSNGQFDPPEYSVLSKDEDNISSIMINGVKYKNNPTKIFGYLGYPKNADNSKKLPAIDLVHGGYGKAFKEWVKKWNEQGYIAIAIDTEGNRENGNRDIYSGPQNDGCSTLDLPIENQWMYQAISAVTIAHSLLLNDAKVDANKTGICGISWGGFITCNAIGIDTRYSFAISIYGDGFISETKGLFGDSYEHKDGVRFWDGSKFYYRMTNCKVLFINSDHDQFFSLNSVSKNILNIPNSKMSIDAFMEHSHEIAWNKKESYEFANDIINGKNNFANILLQPQKAMGRNVEMYYDAKTSFKIDLVEIYALKTPYEYIRIDELNIKDDFICLNIPIKINKKNGIIKFTLPNDIMSYYVNIVSKNGLTTSSVLVEI